MIEMGIAVAVCTAWGTFTFVLGLFLGARFVRQKMEELLREIGQRQP